MAEMNGPDLESIGDLQQEFAALREGKETDPEQLVRFQIALQKWTLANQRQSQMVQEMADALKDMIHKVG